MKLIYIHLDEPYKNLSTGGYKFDNEFLVEFNTRSRKISIVTNDRYIKLQNNSISNITCIVGKNGIGKTTFFELLIAPLLWRLDGESHVGKIHCNHSAPNNKKWHINCLNKVL